MVDLRGIIDRLVDLGFYSVFLPFILVYVIVFAVLEKAGVFKSNDDNSHVKSTNSVIAFVAALFTVASIQTVRYIQDLILSMVLILIFILVVLMLLGFIFGDKYTQLFINDGKLRPWAMWGIGGTVFIVCLFILLHVLGVLNTIINSTGNFLARFDYGSILFVIAIIAIVIWVTKDSKPKKDK